MFASYKLGQRVWVTFGSHAGARGEICGVKETESETEFPRYELYEAGADWMSKVWFSEPVIAPVIGYKICNCGQFVSICDILISECPARARRRPSKVQLSSVNVCICGRLDNTICCGP